MRLVSYTVYIVGILLILGSAQKHKVNKDYAATGGSKADGVINLSYEFSNLEMPVVDKNQGKMQAEKRCIDWGYAGAKQFDETVSYCINPSNAGCQLWRTTLMYQCTGSL